MSRESERIANHLGWQGTYEGDFAAWAHNQAARLLRLQPAGVDWQNVAEELSDMGRGEQRALESYLELLLVHLLKWRYQPKKRSRSWEASIENARDKFDELLNRSPSLFRKLDESLTVAYRRARRTAGAEMGWSKKQRERRLPVKCEWPISQVRDADFWPSEKNDKRRPGS